VTQKIELQVVTGGASTARALAVDALIIAGWTGRDHVALEAHIAELEREGVARPDRTPMFYRVDPGLLTTAPAIEAVEWSSGEVEAFLLKADDELWVGAGSDHTDRQLEATSVLMSKQACPKPISTVVWRYRDVRDHWDEIELHSYRYEGDNRIIYQRGTLARNLPGAELVARFERESGSFANGTLMFCGTILAEGGIRPSRRFELELHDPVRGLTIRHAYDVLTPPKDPAR
jgi:hypothetical protein